MGARMVEFAGWEMPISFAGIVEEHNHTRNACSVFDVSHMGRLRLTGRDCQAFLNRICTRNLATAEPGRSYYSHICRDDGGILDDVIVSCGDGFWGIVCNASNRQKIVAWLKQHIGGQNVELKDETLDTAMVAVQGPRAVPLAQQLSGIELAGLKRYRFLSMQFAGIPVTIYRSGYTGEDGIEIVLPAPAAELLVTVFGNEERPHPEIRPAGLGARDTLRIEAAMPLYGHELTEDWDSLTSGQGWCVDLTKDFIGADAMRRLQQQGLPRQVVGLELEGRRIARQHHKVYAGSADAGEVTSGTLSPTLGKSIAMALVRSEYAAAGTALEVDLGKARAAARVVPLPFYKRAKSG